jgi:flagellar biosynthesis protein FlhF
MELEQFIASSAADAAQQIRAKLGAGATVVNVRQIPGRWFHKSRIEVLAHAPEHMDPPSGQLLDMTDEATPAPPHPGLEAEPGCIVSGSVSAGYPERDSGQAPETGSGHPALQKEEAAGYLNDRHPALQKQEKRGPSALLESLGLLPLYAERVLEQMTANQPKWLLDDLKHIRAALAAAWIPDRPSRARLHVFVGAPGLGKTSALCKWLTLATLLEGRSAHVWRLDGATANTAEALTVHGDVLGVPVERTWTGAAFDEDLGFVDLPGAAGADVEGVCELVDRLGRTLEAQVHLVLNAAYDTTATLAQARVWAVLPVHDLIVTHLDEEPRWCKLWNLMLGTGWPVRFLSTGQNIPSDFMEGSADRVLSRVFPRI